MIRSVFRRANTREVNSSGDRLMSKRGSRLERRKHDPQRNRIPIKGLVATVDVPL
jgi:hypothetical protein